MPTNTDKLTAIRIKQQNGSYGPQIPVSADAVNVKYDNLYSVKEVLGNVKTNIGPLQEQIDNIDTSSISEAVTDWLEDNPGALLPTDKTLSVADVPADAQQAGKVVTVNSETAGNATKVHFNTTNQIISVLTTDDIDHTLLQTGAAADAKITGDRITDLNNALAQSVEISEEEFDPIGYSILITNKWYKLSAGNADRTGMIEIPEGINCVIITANSSTSVWAFLKDNTMSDGTTPNFSSSYQERIVSDDATPVAYFVEKDMKYLYVTKKNTLDEDIMPNVVFQFISVAESVDFLMENKTLVLSNGIISTSMINDSNMWIYGSSNFRSSLIRVPDKTKIVTVSYKNNGVIAFLKDIDSRSEGGEVSYADGYEERIAYSENGEAKYTIGPDCKWIYAVITRVNGGDVTPQITCQPNILRSEDLGANDEYLNEKIFGILPTLYEGWFDWNLHFSYLSNGGTNHANGFATTEPIPVNEGNQLINISSTQDAEEHEAFLFVVEFNGELFVRRFPMLTGEKYIVPEGVTAIRIMFGFNSESGVTITKPMLSEYFAVKFLSAAAQANFEAPIYVAYGASTTDCTVHTFSGTYKSKWSFPDYVGRALNLQTYNHGHGTTGFIARAGGAAPNFMDAIYADDELLKKASLVTINFGYGNDRSAGLPIGEYDDYYPYDEEGYHPDGVEGIATMIENHATLFGCLNWCIKWISEHYPTVTLIIVFGSPSASEDRTVTMEVPSDPTKLTPYKLKITDPYSSTGSLGPYAIPSTNNRGLAQIHQELPKLQAALNIPVVDLFFGGMNINPYNTHAMNDDGLYAIFSTTGSAEEPEWNRHPNDAGYKMYAQFIAGKVISLFKH